MKKIKLVSMCILSALFFFTSCDKDDDNEVNNAVVSEYKGVLVGSTGAYKLNLTKSGASATILFDDKKYDISANKPLEPGQSLTLTNGSVSLTIAVNDKGENPTISFKIPGHTVSATIYQATATNNVQIYQGYETDQKSTDGGAFIETDRTTYNLAFTDNEYAALNFTDEGVFKEEGIIVSQTNTELIIKELRNNDGGNTPLIDLDAEDLKNSEMTFKKKGNQLIYTYTEPYSTSSIFKDEIILTKVEF